MKHTFELVPRDVLFFRDARPMEASDAGLGAHWPRPDQMYHAIHAALLQTWPALQEWESADGQKHTFRDKRCVENAGSKDKNGDSTCRFGSLKVMGPFPKKGEDVFLPCPLDWGMRLVRCEGTNLPTPLTHGFLPKTQEKKSFPAWIPVSAWKAYAEGKAPESEEYPTLFGTERNIGIAIDSQTGTVVDGKLYQAEYLRLASDVSMVCAAECVVKQRRGLNLTDVFSLGKAPQQLIFGGQQGMMWMKESEAGEWLLEPQISSEYVRWTLISPALFTQGWKPGWLSEDGRVMLPRKTVERQDGESRSDWKRRQAQAGIGFEAKLIAARIGKPLVFSGWNVQAGGPKATQMAVPAGASYVFQCSSISEAKALAAVLQAPIRRSDYFGEKGYGIGFCSSVQVDD